MDMFHQILALMKEIAILVAHRLAMVINANVMVVFKDG
jgi:ABC-type transport system involved in Fe-S cluster assembly fused permease/ATPase subunit